MNTKENNKRWINELNNRVKNIEIRIARDEEKLTTGFAYYFSWCAEDLWKAHYEKDTYVYWASILEEGEETSQELFERELARLQQFCLMPYNVRENSTGSLHREVSTWKFQANLEFITTLKTFLNPSNNF